MRKLLCVLSCPEHTNEDAKLACHFQQIQFNAQFSSDEAGTCWYAFGMMYVLIHAFISYSEASGESHASASPQAADICNTLPVRRVVFTVLLLQYFGPKL